MVEGGKLIQARRHRADTREEVKTWGVVVQKVFGDRENVPAILASLITISNLQRPRRPQNRTQNRSGECHRN